MAVHFKGTISGNMFAKAFRVANKTAGLKTRAISPQGMIETRIWHDYELKCDRFEVYQLPWNGKGIDEPLTAGVMGKPTKPPVLTLTQLQSPPLSELEEDAKWKEEEENALLIENAIKEKRPKPKTPFAELQDLSEKMATLTETESKILELVMQGHTSASISKLIYRSVKTVSHHRHRMLAKLDATNTADLVRIGTVFQERSRFEGC